MRFDSLRNLSKRFDERGSLEIMPQSGIGKMNVFRLVIDRMDKSEKDAAAKN